MLLATPTGPVPPASLLSGQPLHAGEWLAELPLLQCCPGSETFHPCLLSLARSSTFKRNFPEPHPSSPLPSALLRPGFNSHQSPEKLLMTCLWPACLLPSSSLQKHSTWLILPPPQPPPSIGLYPGLAVLLGTVVTLLSWSLARLPSPSFFLHFPVPKLFPLDSRHSASSPQTTLYLMASWLLCWDCSVLC